MSSKSKKAICSSFAFITQLFLICEFIVCIRLPEYFISSVCIVRLIVSSLINISGFVCSFYYSDNDDTRPVIFFLYSYSILVYNYVYRYTETTLYPGFIFLLTDFFGFATFVNCLTFVSRAFKNSKYNATYKKRIMFLYAFMAVALVVKYILIASKPVWSISRNPLNNLIGFIFLFLYVSIFSLLVYLLKTASRVTTMLLRYLVLGIFLGFFPGLLFLVKNIFLRISDFNTIETTIMVLGSSFIAICVLFSFFQFKSEKVNIIIRRILSFLIFATFVVIVIQICYFYMERIAFNYICTFIVLVSPFMYKSIFIPINSYLSLENKTSKDALKIFEESIKKIEDIQEIYEVSAKELKKQFDCKYIFIKVKDEKGNVSTPYSDATEIVEKVHTMKFEHTRLRKNAGVTRLSGGSLVYTILTSIGYTIYIYIGEKINKDNYLPTEVSFAQRYVDIFYQQLMVNYSKDVSKELETVSKHSKQLDQEIMLAANIQQSFYPKNIESFDRWEVQYYCQPMAGVSGDLYDFYADGNELKGLGIFDVSGHGIASGLVTMLVRNIIHKEFFKNLDKPLDEVMHIIDERFRREKNDIQNFMSGILLRFKEDSVEFTNGAHPFPIIYKKKTDSLFFMDNNYLETGTFIGFDDFFAPSYSSVTMDFEPGDEIILYTDGINEALNSTREQYGYERLLNTIRTNITKDIKTQKENLLEDISTFVGSAPANDDITYVILKKM